MNSNLPQENTHSEDHILTLNGMYQDYFLDYASYVILERAVPAVADGLKPVQRRILHSMFEKEDGRYHKVANLIAPGSRNIAVTGSSAKHHAAAASPPRTSGTANRESSPRRSR